MHTNFEQAGITVVVEEIRAQLAQLMDQPTLRQRIIDAQVGYPVLEKIFNELAIEVADGYSRSFFDGLLYQSRLCVSMAEELRNEILSEVHNSPFAMHPSGTKIYQDIKPHFWSRSMKKDITEFVSKCLVCQQVKAPRKRLARLLQSLSVPKWRWKNIAMDFIVALTRMLKGYTVMWVIVD